MPATMADQGLALTPSVLMRELGKPADATDLTDLESARVEAVKLRALLAELARAQCPGLARLRCEGMNRHRSRGSEGSTTEEEDEEEDEEDSQEEWTNLRSCPDVAMRRLQVGNARFVAGLTHRPHLGPRRRQHLANNGQNPYVTVLGCSDSRAPAPVLFDAGVGDVFNVSVAGNVATEGAMASVEYGVGYLKTPLLLVLGHTQCGAVTACVDNAQCKGSIPRLLSFIEPACCVARDDSSSSFSSSPRSPSSLSSGTLSASTSSCSLASSLSSSSLPPAPPALSTCTSPSSSSSLLLRAIEANVWHSIGQLLTQSDVVREAVESGAVRVEGALYHLHSGAVQFLGTHPNQAALLAHYAKVAEAVGVCCDKNHESEESDESVSPFSSPKHSVSG